MVDQVCLQQIINRYSALVEQYTPLNFDADGNVKIGEILLSDLAEEYEEYGTPLFVFDEATIRKQCRVIHQSLGNTGYARGVEFCYAVKANANLSILQVIAEENFGADVVSSAELKTRLLQ